ncbi:MAG: MFS transporter [Negativicutes bacterium]|nr:MFS transporter [Negativicutes bacterium]
MQKKEPYISKPLALLTLSHLVTDLSQGALPVLLPFLKTAYALNYTQIGVIMLVQNLTSSVIQPLFGLLTDKISLPWLIPASVLLSGIGLAVTGYSPNYAILLLTVIVGGLGVACFHPQASKSAHHVSSAATKGRSMGIFSVGGNAGMAIGSIFMTLLLSLPGTLANTLYFVLPAVALTIMLFLNLKAISPPEPAAATMIAAEAKDKPPAAINYGLLGALLTYIFIRSSIHTGLMTYIPVYYTHYLGGSPVFASYLISTFLLAGVAGTFCGGVLSDRIGRKAVIFLSTAASFPLLILLPFTSGISTLIVLGLTGLILIASFATTVVLAQEMMPGYVGMASGLTIGFSIGLGGVGAAILGWVADTFGIPSVFTVLSFLPLAALIFIRKLPGELKKERLCAKL